MRASSPRLLVVTIRGLGIVIGLGPGLGSGAAVGLGGGLSHHDGG